MPSTTTNGYPYPLGTDRVMDGDDSIHALADKVEANLKAGVLAGTVSGQIPANGTESPPVTVTLPVGRFLTPPVVVTSALSLAGALWTTSGTTSVSSFQVAAHSRASVGGAAYGWTGSYVVVGT